MERKAWEDSEKMSYIFPTYYLVSIPDVFCYMASFSMQALRTASTFHFL